MNAKRWLRFTDLRVFLTLTATSVALVHVRVIPEDEGAQLSRVRSVSGWEYEIEGEAEVVRDITYLGEEIRLTEFQEFDVCSNTLPEPSSILGGLPDL